MSEDYWCPEELIPVKIRKRFPHAGATIRKTAPNQFEIILHVSASTLKGGVRRLIPLLASAMDPSDEPDQDYDTENYSETEPSGRDD